MLKRIEDKARAVGKIILDYAMNLPEFDKALYLGIAIGTVLGVAA
jgi:hypothetical protein